jgi:hypothetical protein
MNEDRDRQPGNNILEGELEHFRAEKERIRDLIGQIGGKGSRHRDKIINMIFVVVIIFLFCFDMLRHLFHIHIPVLPPIVSLELAIFLVSVKIIWMIHKQTKVEHFQFWMLNSIEFRLNDIARRIGKFEQKFSADQLSDMENRSAFPPPGKQDKTLHPLKKHEKDTR